MPPTSLRVDRGEVLLVVADPQISRTALALALSGRMQPTTGTVAWGHSDSLKTLRQHSALLDSPEVNEPEAHLKVRDLVGEDLALVPGPIWRKPRPKSGWKSTVSAMLPANGPTQSTQHNAWNYSYFWLLRTPSWNC
ncbi:hypothetical protein [Glutamicibacter sp. M10]|uniref:hypothetical protein n=1 Tax=Glutamicibacter sp. M10 TaxID=3023076 RepID=UPI0021C891FF|nr:hypothetical protein [Glutamicibacter sp. M10]UXN32004.1 hypothetical protein N6V40_00310 [Glutamicibacter sp. M10]